MKALVTILQCRRVVMPYIFMEYCVPIMRKAFGGSFDVLIIQHQAKQQTFGRMYSQAALGKERENLVEKWTQEGRYGDAEILKHDTWHRPYPHIPSFHLAAKTALERNVDFHLYLEDDAIVIDPDCGKWDELMGESEVAVYRPRTHIINASWFLSRPSYDRRIEPGLSRYWWWRRHHRVEWWFKRQLKGELAIFDESYAVKNHHKEYPYTGMRFVVDRLHEMCPHELDLLEIDFGEEAKQCIAAKRQALQEADAGVAAH